MRSHFDKKIERENFNNLSTLCVDDKKHYDKGNISQYGEGQTSLLIMSEEVTFINIDEEKRGLA